MSQSRPPAYRLHKPSGRAVTTIRTPEGRKRDVYLGPWKSEDSRTEYRRILEQVKATSRPTGPTRPSQNASISELIVAFLRHVDEYYRRPDGTPTHETVEFRLSLRPVRVLYPHTPAAEFGPVMLESVREKMIQAGWCRKVVNRRVGRVRRMFKWAVAKEMIPATVHVALTTLTGLKAGRSAAPETKPIGPVADDDIDGTLPFLTRHVRGLVEFQRYTGCRPGEACLLRWADVDSTGPVWLFKPAWHKLAYRNKSREIAIGPKGQAVLAAFPTDDPDDYVFSPRRCVEEVQAVRSANRQTPTYPSHMERNRSKRVRRPIRAAGEMYTTAAIGHAIKKAVVRANGAGVKVSTWHPNQLSHSYATMVRRLYGLESAQVALGHSRADITQVYAEKNIALAAAVAAKVG